MVTWTLKYSNKELINSGGQPTATIYIKFVNNDSLIITKFVKNNFCIYNTSSGKKVYDYNFPDSLKIIFYTILKF